MVAKCFYCQNTNVTIAHIKSCSKTQHTAVKPALVLATSGADLAAKMTALTTPDAPVTVTTAVATPAWKLAIAEAKAKAAAATTTVVTFPAQPAATVLPPYAAADIAFTVGAYSAPEAPAAPAVAEKVKPQDMELGFYFKDGDAYKIVLNKTGTMKYAMKLFVQPTWGKNGKTLSGKWGYVSGAISDLQPEHKMTKEIADNYATHTLEKYGVSFCCVCGTKLTAKESVAKGIGPVCAGKL